MGDPRFKKGFIDWRTLIGKTIAEVDTKFGANVVLLKFTDQTSVVVDTEVIGHGLHTPVLDDPEGYRSHA